MAVLVSSGPIPDRSDDLRYASIDLYESDDGPNILIVLTTHDSISWLRAIFESVAEAPVDVPVNLAALQGVQVSGELSEFMLTRIVDRSSTHLVCDDDGRFVWSCTSEEWVTMSLMLEPFLTQTGHQYFAAGPTDDALIEISYGEVHKMRNDSSK